MFTDCFQNNLGTALFEDIACMIYDLIDARRQYQTYLDNLKLLHIPVPGEVAQTQGRGPQVKYCCELFVINKMNLEQDLDCLLKIMAYSLAH